MKKKKHQRRIALACSIVLAFGMLFDYKAPIMSAYAYTVRSATVQASSLNVRSGPGTTYTSITKLGKGTAVTVIGEKNASDGALWYEIRFSDAAGQTKTGFVSKSYVKFPVSYTSDQSFEAQLSAQGFPESYKDGLRQLHALYPNWVFKAHHTNLDWETVIQNQSVVGRNLVQRSSPTSWKSTANGAYNWDSSSWPGFDGDGWVAASDGIIRHYIDPRNFLDETYIFQFLLHKYDSTNHTKEGLQQIIKGTFLGGSTSSDQSQTGNNTDNLGNANPSGNNNPVPPANNNSGQSSSGSSSIGPGVGKSPGSTPDDNSSPEMSTGEVSLEGPRASVIKKEKQILMSNVSFGIGPGMNSGNSASGGSGTSGNASISGSGAYADMIMNAAAQSGVSPYVLGAMLIQEQGRQGTSPLISGRHATYPGYYNFFNIEAYQSGSMSAIQRGLWYASQSGSYLRPWTSPEKAILGGAMFYAESYVNTGQDTFYLKKFNVQGSNLYKHQYMTNVQGAASEAALYAQAYNDQLRQYPLEFKIPVFLNMPGTASALPSLDGSPNNKLSALRVDGLSLTPTFHKDTTAYDVIVGADASQINISATALDSAAVVSGIGTVTLAAGNTQITVVVTAKNGTVRNYVINVMRQGNSSGGVSSPPQSNQNTSNSSGVSGGPGVGSGSSPSAPANSSSNPGTPGGSNVTIIQ